MQNTHHLLLIVEAHRKQFYFSALHATVLNIQGLKYQHTVLRNGRREIASNGVSVEKQDSVHLLINLLMFHLLLPEIGELLRQIYFTVMGQSFLDVSE